MYKRILFFLILCGCLSTPLFGADIIVDNSNTIKTATEFMKEKAKLDNEKKQQDKQDRIEKSIAICKIADNYLEKGDYKAAIKNYEDSLKYNYTNVDAHEKLTKACNKRDNQEKTIGQHYFLAMQYIRLGIKSKAVDELVLALKKDPSNDDARLKLAEIEDGQ